MRRTRANAHRALRDALRAQATHVDLRDLEDAMAADVELLAWMDPLVEGKRLAFVGESNHFVHEKIAYRLLMVRYLVSRGFGALAEEIAWSDGVRIDRYLATGDEAWLDRVGTFGYEGDRRDDRDDRPTGYLAQGRDSFPTRAFAHEHRRWLRAVRSLPRPGRPALRFFGLDVDYEPGAGYVHLHDELDAARRSGSLAATPAHDLEAAARRVPGETLADEVERLGDLRAAVDAAGGLPAGLRRAVGSLHDGFRYTKLVRDAADLESLRPGMAFRETVMVDQLESVLDLAGPETRFIVFGHNLHLARADDRIDRPGASVGPGGDRVDSLGGQVSRHHRGDVFTIWMLEYEGRDSQPFTPLGNDVCAGGDTFNAALASVGESFFLPLVGPPAGVPSGRRRVAMIYGHTVTLDLAEQTDAVFFSRRVSPLEDPADGRGGGRG